MSAETPSTASYFKSEIKRLNDEAAKRRVKNRELEKANAQLQSDLADRNKRLDELEKAQGKPSELQTRVNELAAENRQLKHSARFRDLAATAGVLPEAIDDAWTALKLKADADEPDEAAMTAALDGAKTAKPYLFKPAADAAVQAPKQEPKPPPPPFGNSRGKPAATAFVVTREQRGNVRWMLENDAAVKAAQADGTIVYQD